MMEPAEMARRAQEATNNLRKLGERAMANPLSAVLSALAAGFVFGLVLRIFERPPRDRGEK